MKQLDDEATEGDQGGPHPTMIITEPEPPIWLYTIVADCRSTFGLPLLPY